jgi:hypothetical protein
MRCVFCGQKRADGDNEETSESICPSDLSRFVGDEVLTNLNLNDWNPPILTMMDDGEVGDLTRSVGLVATHDEISLFAQEFQERFCQAFVPVEKNADVPGAGYVQKNGREAVDRHEDAGKACISSSIELGLDLLVVRNKNLPFPRLRVLLLQVLVSRDEGPFAVGGDGVGGREWAIAVDDQSRVRLPGNEGVERGRQLLRDRARSHIPGDMAGKLQGGQTKGT